MLHASPLRFKIILLLVLLALLLPGVTNAAVQRDQATEAPGEVPYAPGEVLIGWQPGAGPVPEVRRQPDRLGTDRADAGWQASAATIRRSTGLEVLDAAPEYGTARLAVQAGTEGAEITRLQALPWVSYAEPNYLAHAAGPFYPNDPQYGQQWNMQRIDAPDAWSATRGSLSFVVAVLDTGVAQSHPEFAGQLLPGYNYVTDQPGAQDDDVAYSHGTHVTGILAARMNNGLGVAGLAADVKILPLKVLDADEWGRYDAISAAIRDAADRRAQVISLSIAGVAPSQTLQDAVSYAQAQGALVVAAAGNCAQYSQACNYQINPNMYPAAYDGVLAVSASDRFDKGTKYSGYKPYIGLAAPGGTDTGPIWSTTIGGYGALYGTSMSTPLVSAAAALVWTLLPAATPAQIADILKSTADKVGTDPYSGEPYSYTNGRNDYFGSGRLNVANAVRWAYPASISSDVGQVNVLLGGFSTALTRSVQIDNPSGQGVYWQASVLSGSPWLTLTRATGTSLYGSPATLTFRTDRLNLLPGTYAGTIRVQPVFPASPAPIDIRVQMRVSATLTPTYTPLVAQELEPAWLDPNASGVIYRDTLPLVNDSMVNVPLPFPVQFYGQTYSTLQVSDNGLVTFGALTGSEAQPPIACPGDGRAPNNSIYVLGVDWNPSLGGQVVVHRPNPSTFVISWQDVRRAGSSLAQSFQLVIADSGVFHANYRTVESPLPGILGTENFDGTVSQQVICNGAGRQVRSGEPVYFETRLPW